MSEQRTYRAILADPPWAYENWTDPKNGAASSAMETMNADDIAAIPVGTWAARDCFLFLWGTWPKLPQALQVMEAWGFEFITGLPWVKYTPKTQNLYTGTGFWIRGSSELLIIARSRKNAKRGRGRVTLPPGLLCGGSAQFYAPKGKRHSAKPEEIRAWIERVVAGPYLELFARHERPDWDCWGLDTGHELGPWGVRSRKRRGVPA